MHIEKYRKDGGYVDGEGCFYEDAEDFLHIGVLGFCGCGDPDGNLGYIVSIMRHVHDLKELVWEDKITWEEWKDRGIKTAGSEEALNFMYYFLDKMKLTEHGTSIPGWLTDKGMEFLEDAEECLRED